MSFPWANEYKPNHPLMQWLDDRLPLPRFVYNALGAGYPVPRNLNYFWNFGVLAGVCLVIQILTGVILAMHYGASTDIAFGSTEHIMRDVNWGWMLRYLHANGASAFFVVVYIHIFRGFFYSSYKAPREMIWLLGVLGMFSAILVWFFLPWLDRSPVRSGHYRPLFKKFYWALVIDVAVLGYCGGSPAEEPFVMISQIASIYYFLHFLVILPIVSSIEQPEPLPFSITEAVLGKDAQATLAPAE